MKKFLLVFLCVCFSFLAFGCEIETQLRVATISNMTSKLSTHYSIRVNLEKDDRVAERYVDLQIKSSKENQTLRFGEENADAYTITLEDKDYWYNLTYLISKTNGLEVEGEYQKYEDFGSKIFNFSSQNDVEISFRVVAGKEKENSETGEKILVLSEDISDVLTIKVKKLDDE